jgi:large subunit ribosomal protein L23
MKSENTKKNTKKDEVVDKKGKTHPLLKGPRITEKSAISAEKGVYTFNVAQGANKNEVKKAIMLVYGVTPEKISITQIAKKTVTRRGITSVKQGGKKAVVHLKKGDKITFA